MPEGREGGGESPGGVERRAGRSEGRPPLVNEFRVRRARLQGAGGRSLALVFTQPLCFHSLACVNRLKLKHHTSSRVSHKIRLAAPPWLALDSKHRVLVPGS